MLNRLSWVTPFVGVWIETSRNLFEIREALVTPFVGVWIETEFDEIKKVIDGKSHPSWVCGLKPSNI